MSENSERMRPWRIIGRVLGAGFVGLLVFLAVNTASNMMQSCGSQNFLSWSGSKVHEKVIKYGDKKGSDAYKGPNGEDNWSMAAPHRKLKYYLLPGMKLGFVLGVMVGLVLVGWDWWRSRRAVVVVNAPGGEAASAPAAGPGAAAQEFVIPAHWPLLLAAGGIFFHGHLLGLLAYLLAGRIKASPWLVWATRAFAVGVIFFWAVGSEMWWGPGWSTIYRPIANFLKGTVGD